MNNYKLYKAFINIFRYYKSDFIISNKNIY